MKQILPIGVLTCMLWLTSAARAEQNPVALHDMISAEKSFAAMAGDKGIRAAFLAFFTDDTIGFRPAPVHSRPFYAKSPQQSTAALDWGPAFAEVAEAGDLGVSSGPYEFRAKRGDAKAADYGFFVSMWRKQPDGSWKVALDCGVSTPPPSTPSVYLETPAAGVAPKPGKLLSIPAMAVHAVRLKETDQQLWSAMQTDKDAWSRSLASDVRVYREGSMPQAGQAAAVALQQKDSPALTGVPAAAVVARDGKFGYSYGTLANKTAGVDEMGAYLRVWRKTAAGNWTISLEIINLSPRPKNS